MNSFSTFKCKWSWQFIRGKKYWIISSFWMNWDANEHTQLCCCTVKYFYKENSGPIYWRPFKLHLFHVKQNTWPYEKNIFCIWILGLDPLCLFEIVCHTHAKKLSCTKAITLTINGTMFCDWKKPNFFYLNNLVFIVMSNQKTELQWCQELYEPSMEILKRAQRVFSITLCIINKQ